MEKVNNVITLKCSKKDGTFFKYWLLFTRPFHKLTDTELGVAAALLSKRHDLSKVISDNNLIDKVLFSEETKAVIREESGLTPSHFQVIIGILKKKGFIVDRKVNPKYIPNMKDDKNNFHLLLCFMLDE